MAKHLHNESYIDHFLQADILNKLAVTEGPIRFSDLKQDGIENSLFMYHAKKLISRGLIAKTDAGFNLTLKGARWANYAGTLHDFSITTPRPLVQFIIQDNADNVLLAVRRGQLRERLNDYLLPGNIYRYGLTLEENAAGILHEIFDDMPMPSASLLTVADIIHQADDEFIHHVISHIFTVRLSDITPLSLDHPLFTAVWVEAKDIRADNPIFERSMFLPELFSRLHAIKPHEVFRIESK
jgi:ADP-ribose pyrophosphatase YjhB (NUDIX family)